LFVGTTIFHGAEKNETCCLTFCAAFECSVRLHDIKKLANTVTVWQGVYQTDATTHFSERTLKILWRLRQILLLM